MVLCVARTFLSLTAATTRFSFFSITLYLKVETRRGTSLPYRIINVRTCAQRLLF